MEARGATLRKIAAERRAVLVPGASNALAARIIEQAGFEVVYVSGAGVTNALLGLPDLGFVSLSELEQQVSAVHHVTTIPIMVDADTGFGNAVNVWHSVKRLERAGANAIQIEDQVMPKKCGHFSGKSVITLSEMTGKIRAAVDARHSEDCLIVARTDARAVEGFEAAVDRAAAYVESGADMTFVEAPESLDEIRQIPSSLAVPQWANMVVGGKTPIVAQAELASMGYGIALYANVALQASIAGMQRALRALARDGRIDEDEDLLAAFSLRQQVVGKGEVDALERRYATGGSEGETGEPLKK